MADRSALADLVMLLHFGFVLFNVGGLLVVMAGHGRGWRVARHRALRMIHLGAVWFVALEAAFGYACPLTLLEDTLRANVTSGDTGFLQRWVGTMLYWDLPVWVFATTYMVFAIAVTAALILKPPSPVRT